MGGAAGAAAVAWSAAAALAADDGTVIGIADDVAIPFVIVAAVAFSAVAAFSGPKPQILDYAPAKAPPKKDDRDDNHWWKEIKASVQRFFSATKGASRKQVMRELLTPAGSAALEAEAAQHQQRLLAERPRPRQHAERDRGAVGVEERAHAEQPLVAQLGEEHDVHDDEAVGGREPLERLAVRAEELGGRAGVRAVGEPRAGRLEPRVRERRPQPRRPAGDRVGAPQRLGRQRVLVVDLGVAERRERLRVAPGPRPLPAVEQRIRGAQNSATPYSGVDASACSRRGIRPAR
jgi:hypothetical protein